MTKLDVILPAGGKIDENYARVVGTRRKPLVKFDGRTVLDRTLTTLRDSGRVGRIVLVGPDDILNHPDAAPADVKVKEGSTGPENIFRGLDSLIELGEQPERVLICTADLPFLTVESIGAFLDKCPTNRDFCIPLIAYEDYAESYPQAIATFVTLRDGTYTTGCLFNVGTRALQKAIHHVDQVFVNRKSKFGLARLLGWRFVALYLTKRLTIRDIEDKVMELLQCSGAAVLDSAPELAYDIDYIEDYYYAINYLRSSRKVAAIH